MSRAAETTQAALNPHGSAWVGANAGAGKTYISVSYTHLTLPTICSV